MRPYIDSLASMHAFVGDRLGDVFLGHTVPGTCFSNHLLKSNSSLHVVDGLGLEGLLVVEQDPS